MSRRSGTPLLDPKSKKRIGTMDGVETILSFDADNVGLGARLSGGTIEATGERRHPGHLNRLAITGGTGAYANAHGTVTMTELGESGGARLTFHLG